MSKSAIHEKPFSRLSAAAKRVAIAEDILKQIKLNQYQIEQGTWLNIDQPDEPDLEGLLRKAEGSPTQNRLLGSKQTVVVEVPAATCTCCAVGAACASAIRLFNNYELQRENDLDGIEEGHKVLGRYFTKEQVELFEAAFEQRSDESMHEDCKEKLLSRALEFGCRYDDDTKRAEAIFRNIVKNNGVFVP